MRFGLLGRLLNKYLVDMFSSIEDSRLYYIRHHVQTRIAARSELDETIDAEGGARAGRIYLPSSFIGPPRICLDVHPAWPCASNYFLVWNCLPVAQAGRLPVLSAACALSHLVYSTLSQQFSHIPSLSHHAHVSEQANDASFFRSYTSSCPLYHFERLIFNSELFV